MEYTKLLESHKQLLDLFEPFDWFVTHTFYKTHPSPKTAWKLYNRWIRVLNEEIYGRRYREAGTGIIHVTSMEYQKRDCIHFHALIKGVPSHISRIKYSKVWENINLFVDTPERAITGNSRIYAYDPERNAKGYLSKYVCKGVELQYYIPKIIAIPPSSTVWVIPGKESILGKSSTSNPDSTTMESGYITADVATHRPVKEKVLLRKQSQICTP